MPVLAIPYLVPYANAAGIVIGSVATAVGLSALSDKVQAHMEEFPEESMKILAMIMPEQGIAALFNKEAGDEVEGEEVEEEVEVKDTRTKKEIVLDAIRKARRGRGNYSSPDAEGPAVSGRGSVIRGLEDAGKVDKGLKDKPYKKSKFNWKRFTRNKADGGRIGFEVGGLSDRAQAIYDSWIAAGHTEEDVLAYLTSQGLYGDQEVGIETITNTAPAITQGGDNNRAIRMPITKKTAVQPTLQGDYDIYGNKIAESAKTGILQKAKTKIWDPIATAAGAALDIPLGLLTSGAKLIGGMLPYNERAVMENQMLESGFALDDIGRIVAAGDYNTPEGIMAGYNAAQMTANTFDKRMHAIRNRKIAQTDASRKKLKDIQKAKELWQAAQEQLQKAQLHLILKAAWVEEIMETAASLRCSREDDNAN